MTAFDFTSGTRSGNRLAQFKEIRQKSVCEKSILAIGMLESENARLQEARDAYAKAMAIAMEEGIFPHKEITKAKIFNVLNTTRNPAKPGEGESL